jgi:ectoine hydroxylase-related dioxygenase (phytanoyl-CoA dioxygenase family)
MSASLRSFELSSALPGVVAAILRTDQLRFFVDHIFLKEPGSLLQTAYHQDAPYFPFDGEQAAVCWVPVDAVTKENGAMRYVRGSHRWREHSPTTLITADRTHGSRAPLLPEIDAQHFDVLSWDADPGDTIIHHPRTVHGSTGNVSTNKRRLAASIRYCGDDVRWATKPTNVPNRALAEMWEVSRRMNELKMLASTASYFGRRALRSAGAVPAGTYSTEYAMAPHWCYAEMQDGESLDARDCSRCAFPVVWPPPLVAIAKAHL